MAGLTVMLLLYLFILMIVALYLDTVENYKTKYAVAYGVIWPLTLLFWLLRNGIEFLQALVLVTRETIWKKH